MIDFRSFLVSGLMRYRQRLICVPRPGQAQSSADLQDFHKLMRGFFVRWRPGAVLDMIGPTLSYASNT